MAVKYLRWAFISSYDIFYQQWSVITQVLEQNQIYFDSPNNVNFKQTKVNFGSPYFVIPNLVVLGYGLRSLICLISFYKYPQWTETVFQRFLLGTEIFPKEGRAYMEMAFFLWCAMYLLIVLLYAVKTIENFKFFTLLVVESKGSINPHHVQLDDKQFIQFALYRSRSTWLVRLITASICYGALISTITVSFLGTVFKVTIIGTLLWILVLGIWVSCVCCVVYGIPILISIVAYYFILKQRNIEFKMSKLLITKRSKLITQNYWIVFSKFFEINRLYAKIANELADYNHIWPYYLTILTNFYSLLIVYLTYIIFLSNLNRALITIYSLTYVAHIATLAILLRCASVAEKDRQISKMVDRFQVQSFRSNSVTLRQTIKTEIMARTMQQAYTGFKALNGRNIDHRFCLDVFLNITLFFFLIFKKQRRSISFT